MHRISPLGGGGVDSRKKRLDEPTIRVGIFFLVWSSIHRELALDPDTYSNEKSIAVTKSIGVGQRGRGTKADRGDQHRLKSWKFAAEAWSQAGR